MANPMSRQRPHHHYKNRGGGGRAQDRAVGSGGQRKANLRIFLADRWSMLIKRARVVRNNLDPGIVPSKEAYVAFGEPV